MSTKVKKSIVKIGKDAKKYLESYNEASRVLRESEITWEEICNPAAPFWERTIMQKEFDILREIMNKRRAEEELQLAEVKITFFFLFILKITLVINVITIRTSW